MIVRILGEGQFEVPDALLDELNVHDALLEKTLHGGSENDFHAALEGLLAVVREKAVPVPDEFLGGSDITLPAAEATPAEVRGMLAEDGLIPG